MKLLLVDGSNLLFQMFFGMPARITNKDGKAIQGTLGFVGALLKIIRMVEPTHVAVLFDGESENPRVTLDENYKANREDYSKVVEEENPFSQLADIYAALDFLGLRHAETTDCETDDWMAGYVKQYIGTSENRGGMLADNGTTASDKEAFEIVISSFDSDFFQLISERVKILRYRGEHTMICDEAYLHEKLGIFPSQYAEFKSLTGDAADNIRGVEKVGPKTAAQLMNQFGSLERLLMCAEEIKKPSVRASVQNSAEQIRRNYELIRLEGAEQLPFPLDELVYELSEVTTTEVLRGIGLK